MPWKRNELEVNIPWYQAHHIFVRGAKGTVGTEIQPKPRDVNDCLLMAEGNLFSLRPWETTPLRSRSQTPNLQTLRSCSMSHPVLCLAP